MTRRRRVLRPWVKTLGLYLFWYLIVPAGVVLFIVLIAGGADMRLPRQ